MLCIDDTLLTTHIHPLYIIAGSFDPFDYSQPTKTRFNRRRGAHATSKPLVISDEDSRDTTDYSPVKNRHKRTNQGKANRRKRPAAQVGKSNKVQPCAMCNVHMDTTDVKGDNFSLMLSVQF